MSVELEKIESLIRNTIKNHFAVEGRVHHDCTTMLNLDAALAELAKLKTDRALPDWVWVLVEYVPTDHTEGCKRANTDDYDGTDIDTPYRCCCSYGKRNDALAQARAAREAK